MSFNLTEEINIFLSLDIGTKYLKYSLFHIFNKEIKILQTYLVDTMNQLSINFIQSSTQKILENIQISFTYNIKHISIILDTDYNKFINYNGSYNINGVISTEIIEKILNHEQNTFIMHIIEYHFIIDNNVKIINPLNMSCKSLLYNYCGFATSEIFIKNLINMFSSISLTCIGVNSGLYSIANYYKTLHLYDNIIVIDIGASSIKLFLLGFSNLYITLNYGVNKLIEQIKLKYNTDNEFDYFNLKFYDKDECINFYKNAIKDLFNKLYSNIKLNYYTPIYLVGGGAHIPYLKEFLQYHTAIEYKYSDMYFLDNDIINDYEKCFYASSYYANLEIIKTIYNINN